MNCVDGRRISASDVSAIPEIPSANTNLYTIMLAHRIGTGLR